MRLHVSSQLQNFKALYKYCIIIIITAGGTGLKGCYIPHSSVGGVLISLSEAIQPIAGYITESVTHGQSYCFLPGHTALPLSLGRYSFPIPQRVGGWVGPGACMHTKMVHLWTATNRSTYQAQCTITLVSQPLNRNHRLSLRPTRHKIGHLRDVLPTQLNSTQRCRCKTPQCPHLSSHYCITHTTVQLFRVLICHRFRSGRLQNRI